MGGYGSGRNRWRIRHLVSDVPSVDVRSLARQMRQDGRRASSGARIHIKGAATVAIVSERVTTPGGNAGERPWFVCPRCCRRCCIIYLPREGAGCRRCSRLRYVSQYQDREQRALATQRQICERLDPAAGSWLDPFPKKPPGMRWVTYDRLQDRYHDAWYTALSEMLRSMGGVCDQIRARQARRLRPGRD